jgi:pyruvate carboxylase subunit B
VLIESLTETVPTEAAVVDTKRVAKGSRRPRASKEGHVTSSMPGRVVELMVKVGDKLKAGDPVLVIEAMKMENEVPAPVAGTVKAVNVAKGDSVNPDEALVEIE